MLWLVLNDLRVESLWDGSEFVFSPDMIPSGWLGSINYPYNVNMLPYAVDRTLESKN